MERISSFKELTSKDLDGKVWFMPTDTIPGISAKYNDVGAVQKIIEIKKRDLKKGLIVLIDSVERLQDFGIQLSDKHYYFLQNVWPGPVSVLLEPQGKTFPLLQGEHATLSFRIPSNNDLRSFLESVGPVVSTSLNISGEDAVLDSNTAADQFSDSLDYIFETSSVGEPSTIISIIR